MRVKNMKKNTIVELNEIELKINIGGGSCLCYCTRQNNLFEIYALGVALSIGGCQESCAIKKDKYHHCTPHRNSYNPAPYTH